MEWQKITPELKALLETNMQLFDCEKRAMFGAPTYFKNGNMFTGIHGDTIIIRLSTKDQKELLAAHQSARPFEPVPGRFMKEYIALPESIFKNKAVLREWLKRSFQYASSLAPKEPKKRPAKK